MCTQQPHPVRSSRWSQSRVLTRILSIGDGAQSDSNLNVPEVDTDEVGVVAQLQREHFVWHRRFRSAV